MKLTRLILAAALVAFACLTPALPVAATTVLAPPNSAHPDTRILGISAATAGYTNATTTYTDIPGTSVTVPVTSRDYSLQYIKVCFWADATKATATTGTIQVVANGAAITASRRTIASGAGNGDISECYTVQRSSGAVQTVKLQGVSGDTNTFTVNNAQIEVDLLYNLAL